ncbi:MAG: glycosyltransferase [Bacteroidota bacterium]
MFGISIIVVSYNSATIIEPTLHCLFSQKYTGNNPWEIIFVNNNSSDNTVEMAQNLASKANIDRFKIIHENRPGTAFARFKGVEAAQYDIICFVDDDNRVASNWIEKVLELMQNEEIGILGCGGTGEFEATPPDWFETEKEAYAIGSLYPNQALLDTTFDANLPTAGMCIRKEIFANLKEQNWQAQLSGRIGDSQAPGEDTELCQAARLLGYKTFYTNELHFIHYMPKSRISWERFLKMTYGFGVTDVFLLPYKLVYDKRFTGSDFKYFFRKLWYINYLGKKIALFFGYFKYKSGKMTKANFEKITARNAGFCETILKEKDKFKRSFFEVQKLTKII